MNIQNARCNDRDLYSSVFTKSVNKIQVSLNLTGITDTLHEDRYIYIYIYIYIWNYPAEFFLEWEMFQTKAVEKFKTHILCWIISRRILLIMRNVSDKSCRENQNTHFVFNNFPFRKSCSLWDNVEKCGRAGQATDD